MKFILHYFCGDCQTGWQQESDTTCDDRCPCCNTSIGPEDIRDSNGGSQ